MADEVDILIKFCEEEWTQARQSENQRATMTNYIIIIAIAIFGLMVQMDLNTKALPLAILLVLIGTYGALVSMKLYERWLLHRRRARYWAKRIDELHPNAQLLQLKKAAIKDHEAKYPRLVRLHLNWLWITIHILIALFGVVWAFVIITVRGI